METVQNFINGQLSESHTGRFAPVFNPATANKVAKSC